MLVNHVKKAGLWRDAAFLTVFAGVLRFFRLGSQSFWLDEVTCARDVSQPFLKIWSEVVSSPPLYHYIVHPVYAFAGRDLFWLRVPAAVFGVALVPLFYLALERSFNRRTAFWGAVILTVSPFHLWYSQEMRMYSLLALESFLSMQFWQRSLEDDRRRDWVGYALASVAGLYTHNWFVFLVGGQIVWGYVEIFFRNKGAKKFTLALLLVGAAYAPWVPWLIGHQLYHHTLNFLVQPSWRDLWDTVLSFSPSGGPLIHWHLPAAASRPIQVMVTILPVAACLSAFFRADSRRLSVRHLAAGVVLPLAFAIIFSVFVKPVYLSHRYVILCLPSFLWIIAAGLSAERKNAGRLMKFAWAAISLYVLSLYFFGDWKKAGWKDMGGHILASPAGNVWTGNLPKGDSLSLAFHMTRGDKGVMDWDLAESIPGHIGGLAAAGAGMVAVPVPHESINAFLGKAQDGWEIVSAEEFPNAKLFYIQRVSADAEGVRLK